MWGDTLPVHVHALVRRFGTTVALDGVSLDVEDGQTHALLGRNGAGKTTLLRVLTGLVAPTTGTVKIGGLDVAGSPLTVRAHIGLVPSGDRSFYLRISGFENLVFFARLRGFWRADARRRAQASLERVGLADAAHRPVGTYSHGMQKRLSVARALLDEPAVLLIDEATHDLDPEGAREIRELVREAASRGTAVLWATQRVDEIRDLADRLTLLDAGSVRFQGTVAELLERTPSVRYLLGLRNGTSDPLERILTPEFETIGTIWQRAGDGDYVLSLERGAVLGDALAHFVRAGVTVVSCRHEMPEIEDAFVNLLRDEPT
jgi:ABC-type multidrug transport system ATPase subunit